MLVCGSRTETELRRYLKSALQLDADGREDPDRDWITLAVVDVHTTSQRVECRAVRYRQAAASSIAGSVACEVQLAVETAVVDNDLHVDKAIGSSAPRRRKPPAGTLRRCGRVDGATAVLLGR